MTDQLHSHSYPDPNGISGRDLRRMTRLAGDRHAVVGLNLAPGDPVIRGRLSVDRTRSGLLVHAADTHEIHDLTTRILLKPSLKISIVLDGQVGVTCDGLAFTLGAARNQTRAAEGRIWSLTEPAVLTRRARRGTHIRKVNISVDHDWFETEAEEVVGSATALSELTHNHLAMCSWHPSNRSLRLAEQIINPPRHEPLLHGLYVESRAIEIVAEAIQQLSGRPAVRQDAFLSTRDLTRARRIRDYAENTLDRPITLTDIARDVGVSTSSLQRLFKTAYGVTVIEFIRGQRLFKAREALERDGITVSEAAYLAGFSSPANFATAFKRAFGTSPSQIKD